MRRLFAAIAIAVIAFTLGTVTRTLAQSWAPSDHVSPRYQQVQAELAEEAAEDLKDAVRRGTKPKLEAVDPYAPGRPKAVTLEERQVRALERIARALEGRCPSASAQLTPAP